MKHLKIIFTLVALFIISCNKDEGPTNVNPGGGKIEVQSFVNAGTVSVGPGGGVITVKGGVMDGLSITVPPGSMQDSKTFTISTAVVNSHTFGADFNPLTPLIRVNYGGGYLDSIMTVKIPVTVPQGKFAMGFYYDEESGELEGIPIVAINNDNIIIATRHFSGKHLSDGRLGGILSTKTYADFIIAYVDYAKLFGEFESGFRPGMDDWEFPNWGSYIAPGGHCRGQSMTAIWYYQARKKAFNDPPLYDRFSKYSGMWQDNSEGYKFASVVQIEGDNIGRNAYWAKFNSTGTQKFSHDSLHYMAFAYSMMVTKQPQLTSIWNSNGGHAMVAYRASNRILSIADPNFPDRYNHFITLSSDGRFMPYESKPNAKAASTFYPDIYYAGKSSLYSFDGITTRYNEMLKHTIGDYPPNNFPSVEIMMYDGKNWIEVGDTLSTDADSVVLAGRCVGCGEFVKDNLTITELISQTGEHVAWSDDHTGLLTVKLKGGENKVPIVMWGSKANNDFNYVDFKMITVNKKKQIYFEYWLAGIDKDGDSIHFGQKYEDEVKMGFTGAWNGNTFTVDELKTVVDNGQTFTVGAKMTIVCNAAKTLITSFTIEEWIQSGTKKMVLTSCEGKNVPFMAGDDNNFTFYAEKLATCSYFTRVNFEFWGGADRWFCDDESFIRFVIPKP
ncbi:MAG: hypothetical protein JNJ85_09910 [Candidatus Kapabacteria bacterium]|nr:hypothetical protein [Candidatus Kapabacteria bacterium]